MNYTIYNIIFNLLITCHRAQTLITYVSGFPNVKVTKVRRGNITRACGNLGYQGGGVNVVHDWGCDKRPVVRGTGTM